MITQQSHKVGQILRCEGCFTEEFFLRGLTAQEIGRELGLPSRRLVDGIYIANAIKLPSFHEFRLGGWAEFSTNNFVKYRKGKMYWSEEKFEKTYDGRRMEISIEDAKKGWLENMRQHKLIKVLLPIEHEGYDKYPKGGMTSQIVVMHPIQCEIVKFLNPSDRFNGVWG